MYGFAAFSEDLKAVLNCSQMELTMLFVGGMAAAHLLQLPVMLRMQNSTVHMAAPLSLLSALALAVSWLLLGVAVQRRVEHPFLLAQVATIGLGWASGLYANTCVAVLRRAVNSARWFDLVSFSQCIGFALGGILTAFVYPRWFEGYKLAKFCESAAVVTCATALVGGLCMATVADQVPRAAASAGATAGPVPATSRRLRPALDVAQQMLRTPQFWSVAVIAATFAMFGGVVNSNAATMMSSAGGSKIQAAYAAQAAAIGNGVGRLLFGLPALLSPTKVMNSTLVLFMCALFVVGSAIPLVLPHTFITMMSSICCMALGYGGAWVIVPLMASMLPGASEYYLTAWGMLLALIGIAPIAAGALAGYWYDSQMINPINAMCIGTQCYQYTFIMLAVAAVAALGSAVNLQINSMRVTHKQD